MGRLGCFKAARVPSENNGSNESSTRGRRGSNLTLDELIMREESSLILGTWRLVWSNNYGKFSASLSKTQADKHYHNVILTDVPLISFLLVRDETPPLGDQPINNRPLWERRYEWASGDVMVTRFRLNEAVDEFLPSRRWATSVYTMLRGDMNTMMATHALSHGQKISTCRKVSPDDPNTLTITRITEGIINTQLFQRVTTTGSPAGSSDLQTLEQNSQQPI